MIQRRKALEVLEVTKGLDAFSKLEVSSVLILKFIY
jgi:hypothetical protein